MALNILKLCVGADSVEDLLQWQAQHLGHWPAGRAEHITRMWPKRAEEVLDGGSLYWVIKGQVLARQRILALEPRQGADGIARCALVLDAQVIRTEAAARRASARKLPAPRGGRGGGRRLTRHVPGQRAARGRPRGDGRGRRT